MRNIFLIILLTSISHIVNGQKKADYLSENSMHSFYLCYISSKPILRTIYSRDSISIEKKDIDTSYIEILDSQLVIEFEVKVLDIYYGKRKYDQMLAIKRNIYDTIPKHNTHQLTDKTIKITILIDSKRNNLYKKLEKLYRKKKLIVFGTLYDKNIKILINHQESCFSSINSLKSINYFKDLIRIE